MFAYASCRDAFAQGSQRMGIKKMNYQEIAVDKIDGVASTGEPLLRKPDISILFALEGKRARKVVSRSNAKATGKYPSWKAGRMVHYESIHELNAFRLLDACHEVKSFREQPCRIDYVLNGEKHSHFPDILVELACGSELLEVKTEFDAAKPEVAKRTEFMMKALPHLGFNYRLVTAEKLAQNPRQDNVRHFIKFGFKPVSLVRREHVRQLFKDAGEIRWGALTFGNDGRELRDAVCRLVLEGFLRFDFNQPMSPDSLVRVVDQKDGV